MRKILKVDNPNAYAEYVGAPVLHPHLALISYDEISPFPLSLNNYGVYGLFIQKQFPKYLSYGTKAVVVSDSSIIAVAPGQIGGAEDNGTPVHINGWALLWSTELLKGSPLEKKIDEYHFFRISTQTGSGWMKPNMNESPFSLPRCGEKCWRTKAFPH